MDAARYGLYGARAMAWAGMASLDAAAGAMTERQEQRRLRRIESELEEQMDLPPSREDLGQGVPLPPLGLNRSPFQSPWAEREVEARGFIDLIAAGVLPRAEPPDALAG